MKPRAEALGTDTEDNGGLVCRWRLRAHSEDTDRRFVLFASPSDPLRVVAEHACDIHTRLYGDSPAFTLVRDSTGSDLCLDYRVAHTLAPDATIYLASSPAAFHTELPVQDKPQQQPQHPLFLFTASPKPQTKTKPHSQTQSHHHQQQQSQQQQSQPGRKRGRPRKIDTPVKPTSEENPSHSESDAETETENEGSQKSQTVDANYPQKGAAQIKTVGGRRSSPRLFVAPGGDNDDGHGNADGNGRVNDRHEENVKEKAKDKEKGKTPVQPKVYVKPEPVQVETRPIPLPAREFKKKREPTEETVHATIDSDMRPATPNTQDGTDADRPRGNDETDESDKSGVFHFRCVVQSSSSDSLSFSI